MFYVSIYYPSEYNLQTIGYESDIQGEKCLNALYPREFSYIEKKKKQNSEGCVGVRKTYKQNGEDV